MFESHDSTARLAVSFPATCLVWRRFGGCCQLRASGAREHRCQRHPSRMAVHFLGFSAPFCFLSWSAYLPELVWPVPRARRPQWVTSELSVAVRQQRRVPEPDQLSATGGGVPGKVAWMCGWAPFATKLSSQSKPFQSVRLLDSYLPVAAVCARGLRDARNFREHNLIHTVYSVC